MPTTDGIIPDSHGTVKCSRCGSVVPAAKYCCDCGKQLIRAASPKKRGNGQGTVFRVGNKWKAMITVGYWWDENMKRHRKTRSKTFVRKTDAVAALVTLRDEKPQKVSCSLKDLYDRWEPTHKAGASTMGCYRAAFKYFEDLWFTKVDELTVDDLQECLDECGKGKRTQENMRALMGLLMKYAVPRKICEMNLAQFLTINAEAGSHRPGFSQEDLHKIQKNVCSNTRIAVIMCMVYTGFRPSEFLALKGKDYDRERQTLTGGSKTAAGRNRIVTVSPKIQPFIPSVGADEPLWGEWDLKSFTEKVFYPALRECGIENPIVEVGGGVKRHKYTPHSCRHTFATLMKSVPGADKDKLELIGHASSEMLRYYQDVGLEDLRKITDKL